MGVDECRYMASLEKELADKNKEIAKLRAMHEVCVPCDELIEERRKVRALEAKLKKLELEAKLTILELEARVKELESELIIADKNVKSAVTNLNQRLKYEAEQDRHRRKASLVDMVKAGIVATLAVFAVAAAVVLSVIASAITVEYLS